MVYRFFDVENLPAEAVHLFNAKPATFFCSLLWYKNWISTVLDKESQQTLFLGYEQDNHLQLLLPLMRSKTAPHTWSIESLGNYYTPFFQILYASDQCNLLPFFKQLKDLKPDWDRLILQPMQKEQVRELLPVLKCAWLPSVPFFCFVNWYMEVNHRSFDEYFSGLSSRVKNTVNRKTGQFNRLEDSKIEILTQQQDVAKAIQSFEAVYALSWKQKEPYTEFIPGLISLAAAQGALRMGVAYIGKKAIAAQLWIVADNTAYIYKLAYDESYKKLSIGSILTATLMRHAIDVDKVDSVDYLSGDDAYKQEWMSLRRERWGIKIFNNYSWRVFPEMITQLIRFYVKKYLLKDQCYNL